jgi:hypothetical protein
LGEISPFGRKHLNLSKNEQQFDILRSDTLPGSDPTTLKLYSPQAEMIPLDYIRRKGFGCIFGFDNI